nr:MAG TPA_asm: hypothetical protein [Caudoviricetes sp.]
MLTKIQKIKRTKILIFSSHILIFSSHILMFSSHI